MRTTLDIDDNVLGAVKELARRQGKTAGQVISALARQALTQAPGNADTVKEPVPSYGFQPLPASGKLVTDEVVEQLRDEHNV